MSDSTGNMEEGAQLAQRKQNHWEQFPGEGIEKTWESDSALILLQKNWRIALAGF